MLQLTLSPPWKETARRVPGCLQSWVKQSVLVALTAQNTKCPLSGQTKAPVCTEPKHRAGTGWTGGCVLWGNAASLEPAFLRAVISWQCCLLTYNNHVKWSFSRASQSLYLIMCCIYNTFHPLDFTSRLILSAGLLVEQRCLFYWQRSWKADFCGGILFVLCFLGVVWVGVGFFLQ